MEFRIRSAAKIRAKVSTVARKQKICFDGRPGICGGTFFIEYIQATG
jgi:hypothetical protein